MTRRRSLILGCLLSLALAAPAAAHKERQIESPPRPGPVPALDRVNPKSLVVCKPTSKPTAAQLAEIQQRLATSTGDALVQAQRDETAWHRNSALFERCCFEHIQDAVNAATDDTDILIMPGVYKEEGSRVCPTTSGGDLSDGSYSYEYQAANPHDQNLIAIIGKTNITLEGTGGKPEDVLIDAGFAKDVGVRCDRCTGFIARNLWERDANEHGIYVVDSDGYVFDRTIGSFNKEYELFAFASDNGIFTDCEAIGGSDSGLYIGGMPVTPGRFASEARRCKLHHNALGFSGTQGSFVWMHDNDFYDNAIGISYDSETDHPNFPQRSSLIENNLIHDNNFDIYAATSDVPPGGPGYDFFRYPVGTGIWIVGGDDNVVRSNFIYANDRMGMILARNPLEQPTPGEPGVSQVNGNQIYGNIVGVDPSGAPAPNLTAFPPGGDYAAGGSDFWWDETGNNNCWGPQDTRSGPVKGDPPNGLNPLPLPGPCPSTNVGTAGNPLKLEILANCALDGSSPPHTNDATYPCPWGQTNDAPYRNRDEQECGNWMIDLGEDCDPGYDNTWSVNLSGETCQSLGHGNGTLGCKADCTWDYSGCQIGNATCGAASACGTYTVRRLKLSRLAAPGGDDKLGLSGVGLSGAGKTFDPRNEELALTLRDQGGVVHTAIVPAGSLGWSARPTAGMPNRYLFSDPSGAHGGVRKIVLRTRDAAGFAGTFRADVKLQGADLGSASDAAFVSANLRVGDDCWQADAPCELGRGGASARCQPSARSCPAP
jgi:hypothetical protein